MKMLNIIFRCLIVFIASQTCFAQEKSAGSVCTIPVKVFFGDFNKAKTFGQIFLLVEAKYFTENDLKAVFVCYSSKYPKPLYLKITAFSNEKRFRTGINDYRNLLPIEKILDSALDNEYEAYFILNWVYENNKEESFLFGPFSEGQPWRRVYLTADDYMRLKSKGQKN